MWIERMVDAGYTAVVDDGPLPPPPHFNNDYEHLLAQPTSLAVLLTADRAALRARVQRRSGRFDAWMLEHLDELLDSLLVFDWSGWLVIDTTGLTQEQVSAQILSEL